MYSHNRPTKEICIRLKLALVLSLLALNAEAATMTSVTVIGGRDNNVYPIAGYTNNIFISNTTVGVAVSATCPTGMKRVCFSVGSTGNYLTKPNGAGTPVTSSTVTDGTGWERNRACMDVNVAISGSTSLISYIGVASEAASNSIPYSCYTTRGQ